MSEIKSISSADFLKSISGIELHKLEEKMLAEEQVECPVFHHFGPGVYIREVWLRAGVFAIGHYQKKSQMNVMVRGKVRMLIDDKESVVEAPMIYVGSEGRKMGYIEEDTVWLNIFPNPNDERDIDALEDMFIDKSDTFNEMNKDCDRSEDREDFKSLVAHFGFDEREIRKTSENIEDQIPMPEGYSIKISVRKSDIEGVGLFANAPMDKGEIIAPARLNGMRTPAGRYTNHAKHPNCEFVMIDSGDIYLVSKEKISGCLGGGKGTELTVSYYQALELSGIHKRIE